MEVEIRVGSEFLIQFKRLSKKYRSLKSNIKDLKDSLVISILNMDRWHVR